MKLTRRHTPSEPTPKADDEQSKDKGPSLVDAVTELLADLDQHTNECTESRAKAATALAKARGGA
jgi:hypothetical protein